MTQFEFATFLIENGYKDCSDSTGPVPYYFFQKILINRYKNTTAIVFSLNKNNEYMYVIDCNIGNHNKKKFVNQEFKEFSKIKEELAKIENFSNEIENS